MSNTNPNYGHSGHTRILSNIFSAMNNSALSNAISSSNDGASVSSLSNGGRQKPLLEGYLYKLHKKSSKTKKYFVIFDDAPDKPGTGRLEYFDSKKKFRSIIAKSVDNGMTNPKRSIVLCKCFNINRRLDTKHKFIIGLYRKDDIFSIIMKDEEEMNAWLMQLLILQRGTGRPTFEHVWEVNVLRRGLGEKKGISGSYRLCLNDTKLTLVRVGPPTMSSGENRPELVEFSLAHMRSCGFRQSFFYLDMGRLSNTGPGEIWMETYDAMIAENMNTIIFNAPKSRNIEENLVPMIRIRSQSANESSKPTNHRRTTMTDQKPNFLPSESLPPDSPESSTSTTTSVSTVVMNPNALKPKNSQTHSSSQTSLQSTYPPSTEKANCTLFQCSYANLPSKCTNNMDQNQASTSTGASSFSHGTASSRDRCDSFPSTRNRTSSESSGHRLQMVAQMNGNNYSNVDNNNMPPPRKIPDRPHSMYNSQRHGHSPPMYSSPLSPPAYSTESDGSSISTDEADGILHSITPDDHSYNLKGYQNSFLKRGIIPEETETPYWQKWNNNVSTRYDDHNNKQNNSLSLPLMQNPRKGSPTPANTNNEAYTEMGPYSPCSSSPGELNAYVAMSPSGNDYRRATYTSSSGAHSRASSLAEDNEVYLPMQPSSGSNGTVVNQVTTQSSDTDGYMNMQPSTSTHSSATQGGDMSSATSSCSITSGTPSTDIRFSEYHLDKVQARFTPSEDDDILDKPPRTYSVGSKLEFSKRKLPIDRIQAESMVRIRAYSVGSGLRNVKSTRTELTNNSSSSSRTRTPSHNSVSASHSNEINNNNSDSKNKKSSSAPLLINNKKMPHGSFDHMDDLMEIDFSSSQSVGSKGSKSSIPVNIPTKPNDDYMNMSGKQPSRIQTPSNDASDYVDMKPAGSQRTSESNDNDYMDMKPARALNLSNTSSSLSSSPVKTISTPRTVPLNAKINTASDYMDMSSPRSYDGSNRKARYTSSSLSSVKAPSDDYLNMSPVNKSLLEVELPKRSSVPDGYMEMSWNSKNKRTLSGHSKANENPSSSSDEYINMDYSNNNDGASTSDSSSSSKDRSISMPIAIQKKYLNSRSQKNGSSIKPGSSVEGVGGMPPTFLSLNKMTSSTGSSTSCRTRCDSRDSGIVTPSSGSQATIFPFSPGSPIKQFYPLEESARKCLMDGSTGTLKLSEEDTIEEEPRTPVPISMNASNEKQVETLSNDYAIMNIGEPVSKKPNLAATPVQIKSPQAMSNSSDFLLNTETENHDYINCIPRAISCTSKIVTPKPITLNQSTAGCRSANENCDYAVMNPLAKSTLSPVQPSHMDAILNAPPTIAKKSLLLSLSSQEKLNSNSCFKPIVEDESMPFRNHTMLQRQISEKGRPVSIEPGYEILARPSLSRPNSVNSEKIKSTGLQSNRPNSANGDRLNVGSSSSSTSTLCEIRSQSSSTHTLRNMIDNSTIPSPMSVTSRPESVTSNDVHMTSRPPSVSSERELHYASLDLPQSNSNTNQPSQKMDVDEQTTPQTSSSSSSASSQQSQPAFTYAQIDFVKSENLKAQQIQQNQLGSKKK